MDSMALEAFQSTRARLRGSSGDILIETGDAESGDAGRLTLSVGSSTGIGGDISVTAGASADSARGGGICVTSGAAAESTSGPITLRTPDGGEGGSSGDVLVTTGRVSVSSRDNFVRKHTWVLALVKQSPARRQRRHKWSVREPHPGNWSC